MEKSLCEKEVCINTPLYAISWSLDKMDFIGNLLLKYQVTYQIIVKSFWKWTFVIISIIWVICLFILNISMSMYDFVPVLCHSYNLTYSLWYQHISQTSWTPES